ncbi:hypothetical protein ACOMICROBIO_LMKGKHOH_01990 [Vibrio sp. B1FIG11]|nr:MULTISPECIES: class IIb bacteriocin, lactobin A/cerein 7B family [unclassified Vibrio]MCX2789140.1 class IIb bacteriocin, lactobin A/cerein 7B family [Vibrio sp. Sgm 5]CAD7805467.1 hypothetical protein ACOMICROBIO_LMKGKHOH_01990 [Vibrio sp. B1FIG11]CAE6899481.1 hypothetical protein ACOMICROBIO_LMKGKHOH_01990 [Vibrio sp. B1FIG11]
MKELSFQETQKVSGGIAPALALAAFSGGAAFGAGLYTSIYNMLK